MRKATLVRRLPLLALCGILTVGSAAPPSPNGTAPGTAQTAPSDLDARVEAVLAGMSLDQKIAQVVMPDTASFNAADMTQYRFGSYLSGGNSGPGGDERASPARWLALADANWDAAMAPRADGRAPIPTMWAIDALHGHNNIVGATLFPHNIGLGATRDSELVREIGAATAAEIAVTGIDWTFAPTLAVVRDPRWGRTYESYGERPEVVASMAGAMVEGLQGTPGTPGFLGPDKVIATAKHFLGDGGTGGKDQGNTVASEADLRRIHAAGYIPAIAAGVQTVMASFSSVNGVKQHGDKAHLTSYLRGPVGVNGLSFKGLVVGDWNGHGQVPGCSVESCAASFNAGLDIFMVPDNWKSLLASTTAQVKSGEISMARLDEAVRRILRVKIAAGLFEKGRPSSRPLAGKVELLASADHRALARRAVRESLVLLKNNGNLLPLKPAQRVLVTGDGADNIAMQSGGWTISWQGGGDLTNADFPHAQSIYGGIADAVRSAGGSATLSNDGSFTTKPDVAIVVFGEKPYAEFMGDVDTLEFHDDLKSYKTMQRLRAAGVPVVAVFLSGRPMWVNPEINAADAFVAAFLPGSEGGGVADMLFAKPDGTIAQDFRGKLSFTWPNGPMPAKLETPRDPGTLFPFGYGLQFTDHILVGPLRETAPMGQIVTSRITVLGRTGLPAGWGMALAEAGAPPVTISSNAGQSQSGALALRGIDRDRQEDARLATWRGGSAARVTVSAPRSLDLSAPGQALVIDLRVVAKPTGKVTIGVEPTGTGKPADALLLDATALLAKSPATWRTVSIPLRCIGPRTALRAVSAPFVIETAGQLSLALSDIRIAPAIGTILRCPTAAH
ncbi:glycoside hydrolase family 3 N-terminal domain-containing protein [Sphingomonas sp. MMS24-J45]|uniref:glycoside hydrolase family 3 protein n=1 Tax=Sphingomonas sp. MMS24-J45 TaxID=3238806 RepID=UPI00384EB092